MSKVLIKKILSLMKDLPDTTDPEEMEELMYSLYAKKEILKGLEDIKKGNLISLDEF